MSRPSSLPDPFATLIQITAGGLADSRFPASAPSEAAFRTPDAARPPRLSLIERLDEWLWRLRQRDVERSLESAADIAEVERRLRERNLFHRYY